MTVRQAPEVKPFLERAARNFAFSGIGTAASFVISFLFAGLTIRYLGAGRSGFFMALTALTGLTVFLGDFGLGTPAVRSVAILNAQNDGRTARRLIGSVVTASAGSAILIAIPVVLFYPSVFQWTKLDGAYRSDAYVATILTMASFVLTQGTNVWRGAYTSLERYDLSSGINSGFGFLNGICGIAVLGAVPTMSALAAVRLVLNVVRVAVDAACLGRLLGGPVWPAWDWEEIRPMLRFGGWVYLGSFGNLFLARLNSLILTTFLGSAFLPFYEFPQRIFSQVHTALAGQSQFLFPMLASYGDDALKQIRRLEDRLRWFLAVGSGILYAGLAVIGPDLVSRLVNPEFARMVTLPLYLVCIQGFFQALDIVPYYSSYAVGVGKPNSVIQLVQGVFVSATALLLIPKLGYVGASAAQLWVVPVVVIHVIWVERIVASDAPPAYWLSALISPAAMVATCIIVPKLLVRVFPDIPFAPYSFALVGGIAGICVLVLLEGSVFRRERRWETLSRVATLPISRLQSLVGSRSSG